MKWMLIMLLSFPFALFGEGYKADSLKVTELVQRFVKDFKIAGSDLEIVHKIIEVTHDNFLFVKIDRPELKKWIRDEALVEDFKRTLEAKKIN